MLRNSHADSELSSHHSCAGIANIYCNIKSIDVTCRATVMQMNYVPQVNFNQLTTFPVKMLGSLVAVLLTAVN